MDQLQILGLVALGAALLKAAILAISRANSRPNTAFVLLCLSMISQNSFEFLTFSTYSSNSAVATYFAHGVMLSLNLLTLSLLYFTLTVVESPYRKTLTLVFGAWSLICAGLLLSGNLVRGYEQFDYSIASIPANLYLVFAVYVLTTILLTLVLLSYSSFSAAQEVRERSRKVLIAVAPICLIGLAALILKTAGYSASTVIFMPIATTFFVGMVALYQSGRIVSFEVG